MAASLSISSFASQLTFDTDYSYSIEINAVAKIQSASIFGAMYGMETLGVESAGALRDKLPQLRAEIADPRAFKRFYNYFFLFARVSSYLYSVHQLGLGLYLIRYFH